MITKKIFGTREKNLCVCVCVTMMIMMMELEYEKKKYIINLRSCPWSKSREKKKLITFLVLYL